MSDLAGPEERYCTHHQKTISIQATSPENGESYRVCSASLSIKDNQNPCANAFCIHSILAMVLAKPALLKKGLPIENATQAELQAVLLSMGIEDCAPVASSGSKSQSSGGCFVATVCFGDPDATEVRTLRRYRDCHLAAHRLGRLAIRVYYGVSPSIAGWLSTRPKVQAFVRRAMLQPIVRALDRRDE